MAKPTITGSFVALITPFNRDGGVDIGGFKSLIDFQAENGTNALLIMGSTGEVSLLTKDERRRVIAETVRFKKPGMPLMFGCTGQNTRDTVEMVEYAGKEGADGAIVTVPSYIYPPVDAALAYFLEVADKSPIPIGIYNNPTRVGTDLPADAIIRLAEHPNIVIVKEAMARPGQIAEILAAKKELSVMCCDSPKLGLVPAVMSLGGHGTANMTGNIAPREMAAISKPWTSYEDAIAFREAYLKLLPLIRFTYSLVNPVPVKSLAKALGLPSGDLRSPYQNMSGGALDRGLRVIRDLGLAAQYAYSLPANLAEGEAETETASEKPAGGACFLE